MHRASRLPAIAYPAITLLGICVGCGGADEPELAPTPEGVELLQPGPPPPPDPTITGGSDTDTSATP